MKHEQEYFEPLVVDEVWIRQDEELIKLEQEEADDEYDTQGQ